MIFAALLAAATGGAEPHPVTAELVVAGDGGATLVGVELAMQPGWHVYWRHPGQAGLATEVRVAVPGRAAVPPVRWPTPIRFTQPGGILGFGYEDEVLLLAELAPDPPVAGPVGVEVAWLACKDVCILGEASFTASEALVGRPPARDLGAWRASLPVPADGSRAAFSVRRGEAAGDGRFTFWVSWAVAPPRVELIPDLGPDVTLVDLRVATRGGLTRVDLELRPGGGAAGLPASIPAVLAAAAPDGSWTGVTIELDLEHD